MIRTTAACRAALGLFFAAGMAASAHAESPWLEVGDMQARQDVQTLKAARLIRGPIDSWPLPFAQIMEGVEAAESTPARPHVRAAAARLRALAAYAAQPSSYEFRAYGTNDRALIKGFNATAREDADIAFRVSRNLGALYVTAGAGYRSDQKGDDFHLEPAYAALTLGNWALYGGYVEKYWGAGDDGSLILGNNARPFPKLGFQRLYPYKPVPKFLRWIGPWRFDAFGGVMPEKRADAENIVQIGMQFSFEPGPGLEIDIKRTLLICGGVRPGPNPSLGGVCDAESIIKAVFPFFPGVKPGDSLAGIGLSYTRAIGPVAFRGFYDVIGEDKAGFQQFEQVGQTGGGSMTGPLGGGGASWRFAGEYSDTVANFLFQGDDVPGSFYNNGFYFNGKNYKGDPYGLSIDGDSTLLTLSFSITDTRNRRYYAIYRDADINKFEVVNAFGYPANRVSSNEEKIEIAAVGAEVPTPIGDFRLEGRYMTDTPNTPGVHKDQAAIEASWRVRY